MDEISEVTPHLYVCGVMGITGEVLQDLGITLVVNSALELDNYRHSNPTHDANIKVVKIPVRDVEGTYLLPYFKVKL